MDTQSGPGIHPTTPTSQRSVIASLKRNVLWGVLGLVALVFATVCVMYYTSRQSEAAGVDANPQTGAEAGVEAAMPAVETTPATTEPVTPAAPVAPTAVAATTTPATPTTVPAATTPPNGTPTSDVIPAAKPTTPTTASTTAKPVVKPTAAPAAPKAKPAAPAKTLDANNLPHGTKLYVVKSGDTLEKIAKEVYGDGHKWTRLATINKDYVSDINHLKVGQKILVERPVNARDYADY